MSKAKEYPLEVRELSDQDGGGTVGFFSKGHHDPAAFLAAAEREVEAVSYWGKTVDQVEHGWRRWQCYPIGEPPGSQCLTPAPQGQRGVFPVTIVEWY